ncbi:hypothetical protein [Frisingicoccus sp.]
MENFIIWCNDNVGFISILLSALTLLVSIVAIIVSIHTARLPFRKRMLVVTGHCISADGVGLHITATNVGNRNIKIKTIGYLIGKTVYVNKNTLFDSQTVLSQGEDTSQYYDINELRQSIYKMNPSPFTKIMAFVEDTEGTRYKKKLQRVYRFK